MTDREKQIVDALKTEIEARKTHVRAAYGHGDWRFYNEVSAALSGVESALRIVLKVVDS